MKKLFISLFVIVVTFSCKRPTTNGPQLQFENEDPTTGLVSIIVTGSGEEGKTIAAGKNTLEEIASKRAFEQLMFIGLPNSVNYRLPLIPNMSISTNDNPFLKTFFESRDYRRFVLETTRLSSSSRSSNYRNTIRFRVIINGDAFRKYLEQNGQKRGFGY